MWAWMAIFLIFWCWLFTFIQMLCIFLFKFRVWIIILVAAFGDIMWDWIVNAFYRIVYLLMVVQY
jgi:hypothetical protein